MKKILLIFLTVFMTLNISGCKNSTTNTASSNSENQKSIWDIEDSEADSLVTIELTIEEIQKKANADRRKNYISNYSSDVINTSEEDALALSKDDVRKIKSAKHDFGIESSLQELTIEEAKEDAKIFADMIRSSYGSYYLYDSSEWEKAYNESIKKLDSLVETTINGADFADILIDSYLFINDDHFRINGKSVLETNGGLLYYYYCKAFDFYKDSRGYFTNIENKKWYVTAVNEDEDIQSYMKPTITKIGNLAYQIGTFQHEFDNHNLNLQFERGGVTNNYQIKYAKSKTLNELNQHLMKSQANIIDGYYVLGIRAFDFDGEIDQELYKYASQGKYLKGTSNFIIDSRGNGGGGDVYLSDFYTNYTGTECSLNIVSTIRVSELTEPNAIFRGTRIEKQNGSYAENKNLFVYLVDKDVASAGERGILSIRQMDNALLIGTNSRGCMIGGGRYYFLPNSKVIVSVGESAFIEGNCTKDIEGLGWMPDIYVDGYLALDRAIKMYQYYGLMPDESVLNLETWGSQIKTFE